MGRHCIQETRFRARWLNKIRLALLLGGRTCGAGAARQSLGSARQQRVQRGRADIAAPPRAAGEGLDREDPTLKETFATVGCVPSFQPNGIRTSDLISSRKGRCSKRRGAVPVACVPCPINAVLDTGT